MSVALLAGPPRGSGAERLAAHQARLGPLPSIGRELVDALERSGLRGRGGAAFPVGTKWRSVADRGRGRAVVLANGAEGEPLSRKDRWLMEIRPHLVLDGAVLAARAVDAREVVVLLADDHRPSAAAMNAALGERSADERAMTRVLIAPARYVTGEESAAVQFVNRGVALPTTVPPRPYEQGVGGRPTLVQNVESLAHAALIARFGDLWYRSIGRGEASGSALLTVSGAVRDPGVHEVPQGTTISEAVGVAGGLTAASVAVLLGGYFGGWVGADEAWALPLDAPALRARGLSLGCGVVGVLPGNRCGVVETARMTAYLADQSARQCGPCSFGLTAIAEAMNRISAVASAPEDLERVGRWAVQLAGRGACHHPDGAAGLLLSALRVFAEEFSAHHLERRCSAPVPTPTGPGRA